MLGAICNFKIEQESHQNKPKSSVAAPKNRNCISIIWIQISENQKNKQTNNNLQQTEIFTTTKKEHYKVKKTTNKQTNKQTKENKKTNKKMLFMPNSVRKKNPY